MPLKRPVKRGLNQDQVKVLSGPIIASGYGTQPDGDVVALKADGQFFNSSTTLAANASYTSDWYDTDGFGVIEFFITASVPSGNKGIKIEWTEDIQGAQTVRATEYYEFSAADVRLGYRDIHIRPKLDGFRLTYTNGAEAQSVFYISVTGRRYPEVGFENTGNAQVVAEFAREVALNNVSNYGQNTKFGRNPEVDTGQAADIWNGGRNTLGLHEYKGFNATGNENLETLSGAAADTGTLLSSGTVTTTSATALIDSGANFVGDGVAIGDIVLNDSRGIYGYVTAVAATELTVHTMYDDGVGYFDNIAGNSYRVATAGSTGAAVVALRRILNADFEKQNTKFVILNGVTGVTTTVDAFRCSRAQVILAGSGGANAGEITVRQATTTANIFIVMPIGNNQSLIAADTVPKDTIYLIESIIVAMSVSGGAAASSVVSLRVRLPNGGVFQTRRIYDLSSGSGEYADQENGGIILQEGTDFKLRVDEVSANNTRVSGRIEYLEIDELA